MKNVLLIIAVLLSISPAFAQEKTAKECVKEGKDAYKAKDYNTAYTAFNEALTINSKANIVDTALFYNTGYCAYKSKKYAEAGKLMEKAIELNYKKEKAYLFAANSFKKAKNDESLEATLNAGLNEFPNNKKLMKIQASFLYKKGLLLYNKASTQSQSVAALAESNPEQYKKEKAKFEKIYHEALPVLERAYDLNSKMKNLPEALIAVYEALDMTEKAEKMKKALEAKKTK